MNSKWMPWQRAYQHGMLIIQPPKYIRQSVNRWRAQHDPVSHTYSETHITLTQPFKTHVTDELIDQVCQILQAEDAFDITYGPLRSFLPSPILWLEIQPTRRIIKMRRKLHSSGLFDLSLPHTKKFIPHITITEGLSGPSVDEALFRDLKNRIQGGTFNCKSVAFLLPDENFRFNVETEIHFRDT